MTARQIEYDRMMAQIRRWSPDRRLILVHDILNTLSGAPKRPQREPTLHRALGLLATEQPAPSDEVIQQWLRERQYDQTTNAQEA